jgi:hypothetical protein
VIQVNRRREQDVDLLLALRPGSVVDGKCDTTLNAGVVDDPGDTGKPGADVFGERLALRRIGLLDASRETFSIQGASKVPRGTFVVCRRYW